MIRPGSIFNIGSMFTGYGGLDMAVQAVVGGDVAWVMDNDKHASTLLKQHHPSTPNLGDVKAVRWDQVEHVDVLTAGYPCQPYSQAGKQRGKHDDRHLWPHVLTAIRSIRPRLVVLENVRNHLRLGFDDVLGDLATVGFDARWGIVRASDAGAPHQRARLFVVAYPDEQGLEGAQSAQRHQLPTGGTVTYSSGERHGQGQDSGGLGLVDGHDAGQAQERQRSREVPGDRSPTPATDTDSGAGQEQHVRQEAGIATQSGEDLERLGVGNQWGQYAPAIARWTWISGYPPPTPTSVGKTGNPRLNPQFVEWMMGLQPGWVTSPDIGLTPTNQLKMLGNGVVPQQAALALRTLLGVAA